MAIIVTGASGFLGSKLITSLSEYNYEVIALDIVEPSNKLRLSNIEWIKADLEKEVPDFSDYKTIDAVIHLAGATLGAAGGEDFYLKRNEIPTVNLLKSVAKKCKKFIFASSQVVYGNANSIAVKEDFPVIPESSAYACSKVNAENWMKIFQKNNGGTYLSLRLCGFIDGGGIIDYIINSAKQDSTIELYSQGKVSRDYLHSSDAVEVFIKALSYNAEDSFLAINIGCGQAVTAIELARVICSELNSKSEIQLSSKPSPQDNFVFSIDLAKQVLNFAPKDLIASVKEYTNAHKV